MTDSLHEQYRAAPYPDLVHRFTHPGSMAAIARLFGVDSPEPTTARVLEIGAGRGANLISIARSLPGSACLGVDLVPEAIADAREASEREALSNVEFVAADLAEHDFGSSRFDYIVAHGLFSWTPEPVQQRLLEVCRDHLAEQGVALISFNAMPGCSVRDVFRRLSLLYLSKASEHGPGARLEAMDRVMRFFKTASTDLTGSPHGPLLKGQLDALRRKSREVLVHDELGEFWEPFYLLEFAQWAAETGLGYVADADLRHDWMDAYPKALRRAIVDAGCERLEALQHADFVLNTAFRRALICPAADGREIAVRPSQEALAELWVRAGDRDRDPVTGGTAHRRAPRVKDRGVKAALRALGEERTGTLQVEDLWLRTAKLLGWKPEGPERDPWYRALLLAACQGSFSLSAVAARADP